MKTCPGCGACFEDLDDHCAFDGGILDEVFPGSRALAARYLLEQRVAEGAMGAVFRAVHLQIGSTVAVKLMQPRKDELQVGLARFHREAQILGQIKHPNAVLVMDFGVEEREGQSVPYLVTEFLRGESLSELLQRKHTLTLEEAERIITPLCEAVEEAHQAGVIHRDIKPSNLFLERLRDGSEVVKVLDFGIAKFVEVAPGFMQQLARDGQGAPVSATELDLFDEVAAVQTGEHTVPLRPVRSASALEGPRSDTITEAGFMVGTIPYMAPEQMTGERVSRQSDVFAIASLLFRLLVGRLPFTGTDDEVIAAKLQGPRPRLRDLLGGIPVALDEVVFAGLALHPGDRPGSALELSRALRDATATSREATDDPTLHLALQLHSLSRTVERITEAARVLASDSDVEGSYQLLRDRILGIDRPLARAQQLTERLPARIDGEAALSLREELQGFEDSLEPVTRALRGVEQARSDERMGYLSALWSRLLRHASRMLGRVAELTVPTEFELLATTRPHNPFVVDDEEPTTALEALATALLQEDSLDRTEAFESLITEHAVRLQSMLALGAQRSTPLIERLVGGLWHQADLLMLMELFPRSRGVRLLPLLTASRAVHAARPFVVLASIYTGQQQGDTTAHANVEVAVNSLPSAADRAVLWRCLLAHPLAAIRDKAAQETGPGEFWDVVVYERTPLWTLRAIFDRVREEAPAEYLKIFFLCVRDRLSAVLDADDVHEAFGLLQRFFTVPCFHEDVVFEPLLDLDRVLRERARAAGTSVPDQTGYDEMLADFTAHGAVVSQKLEQMRHIPLPIQRKLARQGHFLLHFISHNNERVARETLPHLLRLDDVTPYLRIPTIHRAVLLELSRHRRFFRKASARLALLQNPKTPAQVARNFVPLVGHEQVRLLASNRHVGADVRALARLYLERLKRGEQ
ncbi:MAG: serine/threonine-protein kinase [Pseudomonadota bacterium]